MDDKSVRAGGGLLLVKLVEILDEVLPFVWGERLEGRSEVFLADAFDGEGGLEAFEKRTRVVFESVDCPTEPADLAVKALHFFLRAGAGDFAQSNVDAGEEIRTATDAAMCAEPAGLKQKLLRADKDGPVGRCFAIWQIRSR